MSKKLLLNTSFHKSTSRGTKGEQKAYNSNHIAKWLNHNNRRYELNDINNNNYLHSFINPELTELNYYLINDLNFKEWFNNQIDKKYIDEFNAKQSRKDRQIKKYDYYNYISSKSKQAVAEQLILQFGDESNLKQIQELMLENYQEDWVNYWKQYTNEIKSFLEQKLPEFKIYNTALHLDETSPHIHIVGTGFQATPEAKQGLKFRLSSTNLFTREKLSELHQSLRQFNIYKAQDLEQLIQEKNIYFNTKNEKYEIPKKTKWHHEKITIEANQENIENKIKVQNKYVANTLTQIKWDEINKKDLLVLYDTLAPFLNKKYSKEISAINALEIFNSTQREEYEYQRKLDNKTINQRADALARNIVADEVKLKTNSLESQISLLKRLNEEYKNQSNENWVKWDRADKKASDLEYFSNLLIEAIPDNLPEHTKEAIWERLNDEVDLNDYPRISSELKEKLEPKKNKVKVKDYELTL